MVAVTRGVGAGCTLRYKTIAQRSVAGDFANKVRDRGTWTNKAPRQERAARWKGRRKGRQTRRSSRTGDSSLTGRVDGGVGDAVEESQHNLAQLELD
ncbi:hypothetical protein IAQ61_005953 [Plenodomus lingam]|uniref:uncharacterized protein n=1 Tax=Leptosphaeria maculans TaxID=5022 RepID=UPI00332BD2DD|nr:hypothetical protein IAQ61_005953 [Plenodomus lingam]